MHDRVLFFVIFQIGSSAYALMRGGSPEKIVGSSLLLAMAATFLLQNPQVKRFSVVEPGVFFVDCMLLTVLLLVALSADRFWTLWLVAMQSFSVFAHIVRMLDGAVYPAAYAVLVASWSYPMILLMVVGTACHQGRCRIRGGDVDWSFGSTSSG